MKTFNNEKVNLERKLIKTIEDIPKLNLKNFKNLGKLNDLHFKNIYKLTKEIHNKKVLNIILFLIYSIN